MEKCPLYNPNLHTSYSCFYPYHFLMSFRVILSSICNKHILIILKLEKVCTFSNIQCLRKMFIPAYAYPTMRINNIMTISTKKQFKQCYICTLNFKIPLSHAQYGRGFLLSISFEFRLLSLMLHELRSNDARCTRIRIHNAIPSRAEISMLAIARNLSGFNKYKLRRVVV